MIEFVQSPRASSLRWSALQSARTRSSQAVPHARLAAAPRRIAGRAAIRRGAAAIPIKHWLMSGLSIASFVFAVMIAGPGLLARSAHGAEIADVVETSRSDASAIAPARVHPGADLRVDEFFVHVPAGAQEPLTALVVLHGM